MGDLARDTAVEPHVIRRILGAGGVESTPERGDYAIADAVASLEGPPFWLPDGEPKEVG
jgi:hypothetical protein